MVSWLQTAHFGLQEILLEQDGSGPATYKHGKETIVIILMTKSLHITQGGHLPLNAAMESYHTALWMELTFENTFGINVPPIKDALAARVLYQGPQVQNKWMQVYKVYMKEHQLLQHTIQL